MSMMQSLRDFLTPHQRRIIGAEAQQSLNDKNWRDAFAAVEAYLIESGKTCDPENAAKAQRIIITLQLLDALQRELHRKVQDGDLAKIELDELEPRRSVFRR